MTFNSWTMHEEAAGLVWLTLDCPGQATNTLSTAVMSELAQVLDMLDAKPPRGLIIRSGKAAGFIAGAEIGEFGALASAEQALALVSRGWTLFNRLAALPYPTLALIRGHCLGGGLELALACRYRIAVDEAGTRLGLPEVLLGIVPAWGGMRRLPVVAGPQAALDMMLNGKRVDAFKAKQLGIVDLCLPPRLMDGAARDLLFSAQVPAGARRPLLNHPLLRGLVAHAARKQLARRVRREDYPAPYALLELWHKHDGNALAAPALLTQLVASPTTANLLRIYQLQERLKAFGKAADFPLRHVHVVGAGVMGADIAALCVQQGLTVTLQDQTLQPIAAAIRRLRPGFERRYRDKLQLRNALDRLIPDPAGAGAAHADVVIEAIVVDLQVKRSLLQALESRMRPDALLGSNTSSLRIEDLARGLTRPQRLVGIHFFNPVGKMPLVEVVAAEGSDDVMVARACAFVLRLDKLPLPVKSAPGFLVNAVLAPYMLEAMRCVDEGIAIACIDRCMRDFGMPLGPLELADTVGLDIALAAGRQLRADAAVPGCLRERVARGDLGRKSGRGFYVYDKGRALPGAGGAAAPAGLSERLVLPIVHKTRELLASGIVADADLADAGVIFGTGFAPFRGGPMQFGQSMNLSQTQPLF